MPVICCVVQTVEPLHVLVILTLFHRALHQNFNDVQTNKNIEYNLISLF